jgi:hypothetical protein
VTNWGSDPAYQDKSSLARGGHDEYQNVGAKHEQR